MSTKKKRIVTHMIDNTDYIDYFDARDCHDLSVKEEKSLKKILKAEFLN